MQTLIITWNIIAYTVTIIVILFAIAIKFCGGLDKVNDRLEQKISTYSDELINKIDDLLETIKNYPAESIREVANSLKADRFDSIADILYKVAAIRGAQED
jgi:hypothetical protein